MLSDVPVLNYGEKRKMGLKICKFLDGRVHFLLILDSSLGDYFPLRPPIESETTEQFLSPYNLGIAT